jgi:uncharacterized protein (DUF1015 family)
MAVIRKFRAWRPKKGLEQQVASYPYDVINSEEARQLVQGNPHSFLHVVKPEVDLPEGTDLYSPEVYAMARDNLEKFKSEGTLVQDAIPHLYVYRQTMESREQYGIVGCVSVDDYNNDVIKKHEHTRPVKEADRMKHVDVTNANAGPIFLTYRAQQNIDDLVSRVVNKAPEYDFTASDGIKHTVWVVEDENISDALIEEFDRLEFLYVADGHHRSASAAKVANMRRTADPDYLGDQEFNYFLAVLFPDKQLHIMDYNRVLKNLNSHTPEELFSSLEQQFTVNKVGSDPYKPQRKGEIGMYFGREWTKLVIKSENVDYDDPVESLDISYLQNQILSPFFGIENPRTSDDIDFVGGIRGLEELERLVDSEKFRVAFAMYPVSVAELMNIADSGEVMPPKSTWFEPKLRSGLLVHTLDE